MILLELHQASHIWLEAVVPRFVVSTPYSYLVVPRLREVPWVPLGGEAVLKRGTYLDRHLRWLDGSGRGGEGGRELWSFESPLCLILILDHGIANTSRSAHNLIMADHQKVANCGEPGAIFHAIRDFNAFEFEFPLEGIAPWRWRSNKLAGSHAVHPCTRSNAFCSGSRNSSHSWQQ